MSTQYSKMQDATVCTNYSSSVSCAVLCICVKFAVTRLDNTCYTIFQLIIIQSIDSRTNMKKIQPSNSITPGLKLKDFSMNNKCYWGDFALGQRG